MLMKKSSKMKMISKTLATIVLGLQPAAVLIKAPSGAHTSAALLTTDVSSQQRSETRAKTCTPTLQVPIAKLTWNVNCTRTGSSALALKSMRTPVWLTVLMLNSVASRSSNTKRLAKLSQDLTLKTLTAMDNKLGRDQTSDVVR